MKYIKPSYEKETIEAVDILLASSDGEMDLGNGVTLTQVNSISAQAQASVLDILGLR